MPQEGNMGSIFFSPNSKLKGPKGLISLNDNNSNSNSDVDGSAYVEEIINDHELAQRKAEEAASRRSTAADWLRKMDRGASEVLPKEPSEEGFCLALRNGLILCNVLNKVNPGAVHKVVENPITDPECTEGAAQSAIQYFENMRNFLVVVGELLSEDLWWGANLLHQNVVGHDDAKVRLGVLRLFPLEDFASAMVIMGGSSRFPVIVDEFVKLTKMHSGVS